MSPKLFLSVFTVEIEGKERLSKKCQEVVSSLKKRGFQVTMPFEFEDYTSLEEEIESCDGLIAFVDEYWTSSTWKATELTFALSGVGVSSQKDFSIPTFVCWNHSPVPIPFLATSAKQPIFLPSKTRDILALIEEIFSHFSS